MASDVLRGLNRFAAPLVGGYAFTYGFAGLATLAGFRLGLRFFDAQTLAWMLALVVYLLALLWGFAARSGARVWMVLGGGGAGMGAAAWLMSRLATG